MKKLLNCSVFTKAKIMTLKIELNRSDIMLHLVQKTSDKK